MNKAPTGMRPEKIITSGVIFMIAAVFIGVVAWGGLAILRSHPVGTEMPTSLPPGTASPSVLTQSPNSILNATEVGAFLELPTQFPPAQNTQLPATEETQTPMNIDLDRMISEMTIEEKIGQMIMTGVTGQSMSPESERLIEKYQIGGVVYFGENTDNPTQVLAYSRALQQAAAASGRGIPLLISIDHEGGRVFRFKSGMTHWPNPMALGAGRSSDLAFRVATANALELKAAGVNLDLAPVLDVNDEPLNPVIGLRAFGGFPDLVSSLGVAYVQGLQSSGVIATAKHFPGHGSTKIDSHEALPVVDKSLAELEKQELEPFRSAIDAGVGVVMVGHIAFPQIDPSGAPASLSLVIIQSLLREKLGYTGVVMTDAMSMGAIAGGYSLSEAALGAVNAGCDLVAYTGPEAAVTAHNVLLQAVKAGRLPLERVDESVRRILAMKIRFGLFTFEDGNAPALDPTAHAALAREVARQSISMVGAATLPLIRENRIVLVTPDNLPIGSQSGDGLSLLGELLTAKGVSVDEWIYPVNEEAGIGVTQSQALAALQQYPLAVVVTSDALLNQAQSGSSAQVNLVRAFQSSGKEVMVAAVGSPFDLVLIDSSGVGLATYGSLDIQIEALADALLSPTAPPGTLPVPFSR